MKILIIVTSTGTFANGKLATGLWLSEFTHIYHSAKESGYDITVANPKGGYTPIDPESLKPIFLDEMSEKYWEKPEFKKLLDHANSLDNLLEQQFDCVYLAGGHGAMYDFPDNEALKTIVRKQDESGRIVSAICHGVSGLLNVKLSNGEYMIKGKKLPGIFVCHKGSLAFYCKIGYNIKKTFARRTLWNISASRRKTAVWWKPCSRPFYLGRSRRALK